MTDITLVLGAPALRGADARDTLEATLAGVTFPLQASVANQLPFALSFPGAGRLYLRPSGHEGSASATTFKDWATFARFVSDVQQIAELNAAETAVEVTLPAAKADPAPSRARGPKTDKAE